LIITIFFLTITKISSPRPFTMARFSRWSFIPRLLYHNTVRSSTATKFHLRNFSEDSKRMRNIWISGLIQPKLVSNEVRNLFYAGRLKDFPKGLIEFHDVLTEFSEQFRKFYGEEEATELYKRLTEEDYHVEGSKQFCGLFPVDFYEEVQLGLTSTFWKDCKVAIIV
jgi:hypothetical protein